MGSTVSRATSAAAEEYFTITNGELERPTGYREWVYVGTPVTPERHEQRQGAVSRVPQRLHRSRELGHWKKTGEFREGTILIKELVSVGSKARSAATATFMGDFIGLEATIKSKKHFPDEPGNWAYFSFSTPDLKTLTTSAEQFPTASCNGCHAAAAADDFVFTQYYPVLRAGKAAGEQAVGGKRSDLTAGK